MFSAATTLTFLGGLLANMAIGLPNPAVTSNTTLLLARQDDPSFGGQLNWGPDTCQGDNGRVAYLSFSYCNVCTGNGEDAPDCEQASYASTTDNPTTYGTNACTDPSIDNGFDGCSDVSGYSFSTPFGFATYVANGNCNGYAQANVGALVTESGYEMICNAQTTQFAVNCGLESACTNFLQCVGQQNPEACP